MKPAIRNFERGEQIIAALLWYGTWVASAVIAVGMILSGFHLLEAPLGAGFSSYNIIKTGVALFIFLPVARVILMLVIFMGQRDYVYTAISALVLAIIAIGIVLRIPA